MKGARLPLWIENVVLLEHFCDYGNGRVDRIRDDKYECLWSCGSDASGKAFYDAGVDLQSIVRIEAWL